MAKYGLEMHPDKTRLIPFRRPYKGKTPGERAGTFDFLGFTMHWGQSRNGGWSLVMKTRKASLKKALKAFGEWCRRHRHLELEEQHAALGRRLRGHYAYFGVNGNHRSLAMLLHKVERVWHKWLERRGQRGCLPWEQFGAYLKAFPLPRPRVYVQIWSKAS